MAARLCSLALTPVQNLAEPGDTLAEQETNLAELGNILAKPVTLSKNPAQNTFARPVSTNGHSIFQVKKLSEIWSSL